VTESERAKLIDRYARGPEILEDALRRVPDGARQWRPGPGKWSVHEIVCHAADSEANGAVRLRYVLGEDNPMLVAYDQDEWARVFDYHRLPLAPSLAVVRAVRAYTVELVKGLPESSWAREATHPESGRYTPEIWLQTYAVHLEKHAGQIERTYAAWQAAAPKRG
jgi:hypothetical protein